MCGVLSLSERRAEQIMTPLADVYARRTTLHLHTSLSLHTLLDTHHSSLYRALGSTPPASSRVHLVAPSRVKHSHQDQLTSALTVSLPGRGPRGECHREASMCPACRGDGGRGRGPCPAPWPVRVIR